MRAGKLDRVITIVRPVIELDEYGVPRAEDDIERFPLRAEIVELTADEAQRPHGASTECTIVFRTRFVPRMTPADTIEFEGRTYDLKSVREIGRRRGLELRCLARGASE